MLDFEDPETGQFVSLTLRNLGTTEEPEWTVYGFEAESIMGMQPIGGIPTMEQVMAHVMSPVHGQ